MSELLPRQLLLQLQLDDDANLDNFFATDKNRPLLGQLTRLVAAPEVRSLFIWGRAGSGKTHLLQAACHASAAAGGKAICVPLSRSRDIEPELLESLEVLDLVCLDDIDRVIGHADWERALFNLYNQALDADTRLVFSASAPPAGLLWDLADLHSRLQAGLVYQLHELKDSEKADMLRHRARRLGMELPGAVVDYVMQRHDRSTVALMDVLGRLDRQSLEQKRRVTVPLVRQVMGW